MGIQGPRASEYLTPAKEAIGPLRHAADHEFTKELNAKAMLRPRGPQHYQILRNKPARNRILLLRFATI